MSKNQKNIKQVFSDIKEAGYHNSFKHQKGYIIVKKTSLIKVRITFDKNGDSLVTTMHPEIGEILFSIFFLIFCAALGGILLLGFLGYILFRVIAFLFSLSSSREFKTEIEAIIR